jgi:hypothetical protein
LCRLRKFLSVCLLPPNVESFTTSGAIRPGGKQVPAGMEVTVDESVRREKILCLPRRFESLHLPFASSGWPMRVFRAIVQVPALSMFDLGKQLAPGRAIASKFIGNDHARDILKSLQQSSKEAFGGFRIPPWLNEDVKHDTVLIHRSPKVVLHSLDPDEHLIKMPLVAGPRTAAAQTVGKGLAELLAPAPNRLVGEDHAPFGQEQLNVPQAEAENVI